jgi:hypothetical protein
MWVASWCGAGLAAVLLCSSTSARALELQWDAPEACPQAENVEAAVARLVLRRPLEASPANVKVVKLADDRWSAELEWGAATRTLYGESCESVTQAVVVILAMAIDPEDEPNREEPPPRAVPKREAPPVEPAPAANRGEPEVRSTEFAWGGSLRTLGEYGILPGAAWGGSALLRGGLQENFGEIALLGLLPQDAVLPDRPNQGGQFYWVGVRLAGCTAVSTAVFACAAFEAGQITGSGFGVRDPRTGSGPWLAPGVQGILKLPLGRRWHFEAALGGFVALVRPEFELDDQGVVHQPDPVSARLELGIGWN